MRGDDRLRDKVVVVIGGSSGIGLATAALASNEGAEVQIVSRSEDSLEQGLKALPRHVIGHVSDAMSESAMEVLFSAIDRLDHVFVTAGRFTPDSICTTPLSELHEIHDSRLWSCVNVARFASPKITAGGSLTFMSGTAAWRPEAAALTSASCGAVQSLARSLAVSLAPIRVNALCPGYTKTPLWRSAFGDKSDAILESLRAKVPLNRVADPEEIADAAVFLMKNSFMNGAELIIDGGARLV